jgi:hypothetical protein
VLSLAAVVATHELAEVFVIANGVRAGRRTLWVPETSSWQVRLLFGIRG